MYDICDEKEIKLSRNLDIFKTGNVPSNVSAYY